MTDSCRPRLFQNECKQKNHNALCLTATDVFMSCARGGTVLVESLLFVLPQLDVVLSRPPRDLFVLS